MHGGRGTPVVFILGLGSSSYMEWRYNLEATGAKHRVFAPDLPGYGRTEKPRVRYSIPYFARFVERYIEDRGLRSAAIVGVSLGGRVALEVALERPHLARKLVLVNTLGLGRPQVRVPQMAYGLVTIPRVGEAVMRFTRDWILNGIEAPSLRTMFQTTLSFIPKKRETGRPSTSRILSPGSNPSASADRQSGMLDDDVFPNSRMLQ